MKIKTMCATLAVVLAASACTPMQLSTYERRTGTTIPKALKERLLAAPDEPFVMVDGTIFPDGKFVKHVAPAGSLCPQWYGHARAAGWLATDWPRLDRIIYRESRCNPKAHNPRYPDDSYGLMQLNMRAHRSWVGPMVGWDFTRLFDPTANLKVARVLYNKAASAYGCGWQPWRGC